MGAAQSSCLNPSPKLSRDLTESGTQTVTIMGYAGLVAITGFRTRDSNGSSPPAPSQEIQSKHADRLRLILGRLNVATSAQDLDLPGLDLHELRGPRKGTWPVKVSGNWRVTSHVSRGMWTASTTRTTTEVNMKMHNPPHPGEVTEGLRCLHGLHRHDWVVYIKKPFGGPEHVLHYLARYTHRVAISNHGLLGMDNGKVTFRWKDYAHGGKQRKMTLAAAEFIRRFLLRVLPNGFVRIRHYGRMANRCRRERAALCRALLGEEAAQPATIPASASAPGRQCPFCGGVVEVIEMIVPRELSRYRRSPKREFDSS